MPPDKFAAVMRLDNKAGGTLHSFSIRRITALDLACAETEIKPDAIETKSVRPVPGISDRIGKKENVRARINEQSGTDARHCRQCTTQPRHEDGRTATTAQQTETDPHESAKNEEKLFVIVHRLIAVVLDQFITLG